MSGIDWKEHAEEGWRLVEQYHGQVDRLQAELAQVKAERASWEHEALRFCSNADFWREELAALRQQIAEAVVKAEPETGSDSLYCRLHSMSKSLEGSGQLDEHENPDAYATILEAMYYVRSHPPITKPENTKCSSG